MSLPQIRPQINPMIKLPNGCHISEMKIAPKNFDMDKDWIIYYSFFDPEYPKPKSVQRRGMNEIKTLSERKKAAKKIMQNEMYLLMQGMNPFKKEIVENSCELLPTTGFVAALQMGVEKVKVGKRSLTDIKSVIKSVSEGAQQLKIDNKAVNEITRKYFKMIFEKCAENNPRFSPNRQNVYRKWLKRVYDELIEMEAVESNPLLMIRKLEHTPKKRVLPTDKERKIISEYLFKYDYDYFRVIQLFFSFGGRETELLRVKKPDVNLEKQEIKCVVEKGKGGAREVFRPITDASISYWAETCEMAQEDDYLVSLNMKPGKTHLLTDALNRRWKRKVKDDKIYRNVDGQKIKGLGLNIDLYGLKYLNVTELMDKLDKEYNPTKDVSELTGHN